jgi:AcrR family transcriptional regulator
MSQDPAHASAPRSRHRIGLDDQATDGQSARTRIQDVALQLFIEEGYDKTSLREIAEKLGVTKAALYYHFPTKEAIVASLTEDRVVAVAKILEWANAQPRTEQTRQELIRRYAETMRGPRSGQIIRFFERNQATVKDLGAGEAMRKQMVEVMNLLSTKTEPYDVQLRRSLAIFAIHASWFAMREREWNEEEGQAAALKVAIDLVAD